MVCHGSNGSRINIGDNRMPSLHTMQDEKREREGSRGGLELLMETRDFKGFYRKREKNSAEGDLNGEKRKGQRER